jgi:hypothetical protein
VSLNTKLPILTVLTSATKPKSIVRFWRAAAPTAGVVTETVIGLVFGTPSLSRASSPPRPSSVARKFDSADCVGTISIVYVVAGSSGSVRSLNR